MQIRRWTLAVAAATAVLVPLSLSTVAQAATKVDVLTISKVKGTNVKAKAVLSAGLASKKHVSFVSTGSSASLDATCSSGSVSFKVTSNPAKGRTADLGETKQTTTKCKVTGSLASLVTKLTITSTSTARKPYKTTITDKKGDHVTITSPVAKVAVVTTVVGTLTCIYTAKSIKGSYSNKTNDITFSKQKFVLDKSKSSADCSLAGTGGSFSAVFGPLKDTSVKGRPKVFVN